MKKIFIVLVASLFFVNCSGDEKTPDPDEEKEVAASAATSIFVDDVTNNGDASDLEVSFNRGSDESLISEYRILIIKTASRGSFNLSAAENVEEGNYFPVSPNGSKQTLTLGVDTKDVNGDVIEEGKAYVVFVLSIADGEKASINKLSSPSASVTLAQTTIKITYIGNDGVYISDGTNGVIIDALPGGLADWNPVANGVQSAIERGQAPYDDIRVAMFTHSHSDHVSFSSSSTFLSSNGSASLLGPPQVTGGITGSASQVSNLNLGLGEVKDTVIRDVPIQIIRITHFDPTDGTDFATTTENYIYIVELGGLKILHIGDGDLSSSNFSSLGLKSQGIDIALIPTFNFSGQLTTTNRDVLLNEVSPAHIIGLHLFAVTPDSDVTNLYPNATVFNTSLQFVRF